MKRSPLLFCSSAIIFLHAFFTEVKAQQISPFFSEDFLLQTVAILSADSIKGRGNFTREIEKAADVITAQFQQNGFTFFHGTTGYAHSFTLPKYAGLPVDIIVNGRFNRDATFYHYSAFSIDTSMVINFLPISLGGISRNQLIELINGVVSKPYTGSI